MPVESIKVADESSSRVFVNKRELARVVKCSVPTIDSFIYRYPDFPVVKRGAAGADWVFDPDAVRTFLEAKKLDGVAAEEARAKFLAKWTATAMLGVDETGGDDTRLAPAQRLAAAKARIVERELAIKSGLLTPTSEVRRNLAVLVGGFAKFLDNLPGQLSRDFSLPEPVKRGIKKKIEDERRSLAREMKEVFDRAE
jgi:phage terminase Nu1 subunit (DNA packaging protein)